MLKRVRFDVDERDVEVPSDKKLCLPNGKIEGNNSYTSILKKQSVKLESPQPIHQRLKRAAAPSCSLREPSAKKKLRQ